jgi:hypothetical protein
MMQNILIFLFFLIPSALFGQNADPSDQHFSISDNDGSCGISYYFDTFPYKLFSNQPDVEDKYFGNGGDADILIPVGWSKSGDFFYYSLIESYSGIGGCLCDICDIQQVVYNVAEDTTVVSNSIDLPDPMGVEENPNADTLEFFVLNEMYWTELKLKHLYSIAKVVDFSKSHFKISDNAFSYKNNQFSLRKGKTKIDFIQRKNNQSPQILNSIKIECNYSEEYLSDCCNRVILDSYFVNPRDRNQLAIVYRYATPCGFENETSFYTGIFGVVIE